VGMDHSFDGERRIMNKNATPKTPKAAKVPKAPKAPRKKVYSGTGLYGGFLAVLTVMAALVILAAQNTVAVPFSFLVWDLEYPLVAILLATIAGTVFLDEAVGFVWRHRRRKVLAERRELKELRATAVELRTTAALAAADTATANAQADTEGSSQGAVVDPTEDLTRLEPEELAGQ
jgi:uncharacterized integral membrane protein